MAKAQPKNMTKRGEVFYWRETVNGKRYLESLQTGDLSLAKARLKIKQEAAREGQQAALYGTRTKQPFPTIGKLMEVYTDAAKHGRLKCSEKTAATNCGRLRMILDATGISNADDASSAELTEERLLDYSRRVQALSGSTDGVKRSIKSTITQARSLFARRCMGIYKGLILPPGLTDFATADIIHAESHKYQLPPVELIESVIKAGRALRDTNRELYLAFILAYDLGLRVEEAAQSRQSWLRQDASGIWWMEVIQRPDENYKPKTAGKIPVPAAIRADLVEFGGKDTILHGTITARRELYRRELSAWMRGIDWTRNKCAHELRKLKGSFWRSKYGLDRAHAWLRHSQYQTTLDYYAALPDIPEPYPVDDDLEALRKR